MAATIAAVTEQETEEDENEYILVRICVKDRRTLSIPLFKIPSVQHG